MGKTSAPGELWTTAHFDAVGNRIGYTVDRADDLIRATASYLAHADLPVDQGCVTFAALNGSFRYRFTGVDGTALLFERVDA